MGKARSRRWFLVSGSAMAIGVSAGCSKSEQRAMQFEDGLAARFERGDVSLTLMAVAHIGGFAGRLPEWLAASHHEDPEAANVRQRVFDALQTGDAATIEAALREPNIGKLNILLEMHLEKSSPSKPDWLDQASPLVIDPLILLGRADLVARLHANSL